MNTWAMIMAAGHGARLRQALPDVSKQFLLWKGMPVFWHSVLAMSVLPGVSGLIVALPEDCFPEHLALAERCARKFPPGIEWTAVPGGPARQDSVWQALNALPPGCTHVLVHDAARPFAGPALGKRILDALGAGHDAVIPGFVPVDTIKEVDANGLVLRTPARSALRCVQTPQGFRRSLLRKAHEKIRAAGIQVTDDASVMEACGIPVLAAQGDEANIKITTPEDLKRLNQDERRGMAGMFPCTGFGYDVHSYGGNRPLVLGGVYIESRGLAVKAHSDGDVLMHALIDALLGAACAGDIGTSFPDSDPAFDNINSAILLSETLELVRRKGLVITHADLTVVAQAPKIAPFRKEIARNLAHLLHLSEERVNVKATTEEGLGFTGALEGIKAMAAVSGYRPE